MRDGLIGVRADPIGDRTGRCTPVPAVMSPVSQTGKSESGTAAHPRRGRLFGVFGAVWLLAILLDTGSKALVVASLTPGEPVKLLGGAVYFTLIRNSGAAFSLATDFTVVLAVLAFVVVVAIAIYAWKRLGSVAWAIGLGLIAGGAMGNLVDRVFRAPGFMTGEVIDFISLFHPYGKGWAIFNLADAALCVGVALVILLELTGRRVDGTRVRRADRDDSK